MTVPSSLVAVTASGSRTLPGSTASEWYRVAVNGFASPANTPSPSWRIGEVSPCRSSAARVTTAPQCSAIT